MKCKSLLIVGVLIGFVFQINASDNRLEVANNKQFLKKEEKVGLLQLLVDTYHDDEGEVVTDHLDNYIASLATDLCSDKKVVEKAFIALKNYENVGCRIDEEDAEKLIFQLHKLQQGEEIDEDTKDKLKQFDNDEKKIKQECLRNHQQPIKDCQELIDTLEEILHG